MFVQKTFHLKKQDRKPKWYAIDASDVILGRLATEVANILRGKNKPEYTPHEDAGDFVVITNCDKVKLTGNKLDKKVYYWHTNHIGGIKQRTAREQLEKHPELVIYDAVKRMMPDGPLARKQLKKLKIYVGSEHENGAQQPEFIKVKG